MQVIGALGPGLEISLIRLAAAPMNVGILCRMEIHTGEAVAGNVFNVVNACFYPIKARFS